MLIVAFWTGGQFFIEKQYVLLVFTGILSLFHGVGDLIKAFEIRQLRELTNLAGWRPRGDLQISGSSSSATSRIAPVGWGTKSYVDGSSRLRAVSRTLSHHGHDAAWAAPPTAWGPRAPRRRRHPTDW
jgi:hypothetical protein